MQNNHSTRLVKVLRVHRPRKFTPGGIMAMLACHGGKVTSWQVSTLRFLDLRVPDPPCG